MERRFLLSKLLAYKNCLKRKWISRNPLTRDSRIQNQRQYAPWSSRGVDPISVVTRCLLHHRATLVGTILWDQGTQPELLIKSAKGQNAGLVIVVVTRNASFISWSKVTKTILGA